MKNFRSHPLLLPVLLTLATIAQAETPYLETIPLSFQTALTITGVSGTLLGPVPLVPGDRGVLDPDSIRPLDRITTDIGTPIIYSDEGYQPFYVKHLLRAAADDYAEQYKAIAYELEKKLGSVEEKLIDAQQAADVLLNGTSGILGILGYTDLFNSNAARLDILPALIDATTDSTKRNALVTEQTDLQAQQIRIEDKINDLNLELDIYNAQIAAYEAQIAADNAEYAPRLAALESKISYLNREKEGTWELTALREAQASVNGVATTPYKVFITRIERTRVGLSRNFDTGFRLTPIASSGSTTETLSSGRVIKAIGSMTTHFRLSFESIYSTNPISAIEAKTRVKAIEGKDYNTAGEYWSIGGTGYMTYTIRSTLGPLAAVAPSKIKATGNGSWTKIVFTPNSSEGLGGIAPFAIKMGEAKFQNRSLFPDFTSDDI